MPFATYHAASIDLQPGDLVCLYSDGITECEAPTTSNTARTASKTCSASRTAARSTRSCERST